MTQNQDTDAKYQANAKKIYDAAGALLKKAGDKA